MQELIDKFLNVVIDFLQYYGIASGMLIIILESFLPILPLGVFVAFNMMAYGIWIGFFLSYLATIIGCIISYFVFQRFGSGYVVKKSREKEQLKKVVTAIKKLPFYKLVLIVALPFTPAFLVNIAAGLSKFPFKKFLFSLFIGKLSIIYFWGFVGKSLLESVTDIKVFLTVLVLLFISYILSKIVGKKFGIE